MDSTRSVCLLSYLRLPGILRVTWRAADGVTTFTEYDTSLADRAPSGHELTALRCTDGEDLPDSLLEDVQRLADGDEVAGVADLTAPLADALIASLGGGIGENDRDAAHTFVAMTKPGYEHCCATCGCLAHDEEHDQAALDRSAFDPKQRQRIDISWVTADVERIERRAEIVRDADSAVSP